MKSCSVDECGRPARARGWCNTHYQRWLRHGDTSVKLAVGRPQAACDVECSVPGCGKSARAGGASRGMCQAHVKRWYDTGEVGPAETGLRRKRPTCDLPGCNDPHASNGLCRRHLAARDSFGDPLGSGAPTGPRTGKYARKPETIARYQAATPHVRADLRMAQTMAAHGRRRDVAFYLERSASHGRPLTRLEREFAEGVRMEADRERDTAQLSSDVMRLTAKGFGAKEIGRRLGVSDRTVVRYRTQAKELENINA